MAARLTAAMPEHSKQRSFRPAQCAGEVDVRSIDDVKLRVRFNSFLYCVLLNAAVATPIATNAPPPSLENQANTDGRAILARSLSARSAYASALTGRLAPTGCYGHKTWKRRERGHTYASVAEHNDAMRGGPCGRV